MATEIKYKWYICVCPTENLALHHNRHNNDKRPKDIEYIDYVYQDHPGRGGNKAPKHLIGYYGAANIRETNVQEQPTAGHPIHILDPNTLQIHAKYNILTQDTSIDWKKHFKNGYDAEGFPIFWDGEHYIKEKEEMFDIKDHHNRKTNKYPRIITNYYNKNTLYSYNMVRLLYITGEMLSNNGSKCQTCPKEHWIDAKHKNKTDRDIVMKAYRQLYDYRLITNPDPRKAKEIKHIINTNSYIPPQTNKNQFSLIYKEPPSAVYYRIQKTAEKTLKILNDPYVKKLLDMRLRILDIVHTDKHIQPHRNLEMIHMQTRKKPYIPKNPITYDPAIHMYKNEYKKHMDKVLDVLHIGGTKQKYGYLKPNQITVAAQEFQNHYIGTGMPPMPKTIWDM